MATQSTPESRQRSLANLRPFQPGDERINRKGAQQAKGLLRDLAQAILAEPARDKKGAAIVGPNGAALTNLGVLLRCWVASDDPRLQVHVVEIAHGKVPNPVTLTDRDGNVQPVTMIEVVKDHGGGTSETLRAVTSSPSASDSLHAGLQRAMRDDLAAHPLPTTERADMLIGAQDITSTLSWHNAHVQPHTLLSTFILCLLCRVVTRMGCIRVFMHICAYPHMAITVAACGYAKGKGWEE